MKLPVSMERLRVLLPLEKGAMQTPASLAKGGRKIWAITLKNSAVTKFVICIDLPFSTKPHRNLSCDTQEET